MFVFVGLLPRRGHQGTRGPDLCVVDLSGVSDALAVELGAFLNPSSFRHHGVFRRVRGQFRWPVVPSSPSPPSISLFSLRSGGSRPQSPSVPLFFIPERRLSLILGILATSLSSVYHPHRWLPPPPGLRSPLRYRGCAISPSHRRRLRGSGRRGKGKP